MGGTPPRVDKPTQDSHLASTYILIHAFLRKQSLTGVARALKKAVKDVAVLKDDVDDTGPALDDIIAQWREWTAMLMADSSPSSSSSESTPELSSESDSSSEESSSDSASSDDDSSSPSDEFASDVAPSRTTSKVKAKQLKADVSSKVPSLDNTSGITLSSADNVAEIPGAGADSKPTERDRKSSKHKSKAKEMKPADATLEKSHNGQSGDLSKPSSHRPLKTSEQDGQVNSSRSKKGTSKKKASKKDSENEPSSAKDEALENARAAEHTTVRRTSINGEIDDQLLPEQTVVTKKRRTDNGSAVPTASATIASSPVKEPESPPAEEACTANDKPGRKQNVPFKRVDPTKVAIHSMKDNRYEAKGGPTNDYGERAHRDLIVTRGAGFRKEKNKKKRGSYKGGEITMASHSFKFTD